MRPVILAALLLIFALPLEAAPLPQNVRAEVDALLSSLEKSGCEFNRNGSWYSGADAKQHILRKLEYLEGNRTVKSTEEFIDLAAATSSVSGKPYLVKCGGAAPIESKVWLNTRLTALRSAAGAPAATPK